MLSIGQVLVNNLPEVRIEEESPGETIKEGCEATDCSDGNQTSRSNHANGLAQSPLAIFSSDQVIHRTKEQNHIETVIGHVQSPRIALLRRYTEATQLISDLFNMTRRQINDVHAVTAFGKPQRVDAGSAAHIQHP